MKVRTRIAPSPTGFFHFGSARTALFNYLFARREGGEFIVRIEDTDKERSEKRFEDDIISQLTWLGLEADETHRQSDLLSSHVAAIRKLVDSGAAYVSREKAKDDPARDVEVVRLKNPGTTIVFTDIVRGDISFDTTELGDMVIARSVNDPLYHLAVVVDDAAMGITHVIRGEDHVSNTPRQILIQEALGYTRPAYVHLPLILMPDKSKMSKRKHQTAVAAYRDEGYLAEALINYLALLGWSPEGAEEILSKDELVRQFSLERIHKSGAVFDIEKLCWMNRQHLLKIPEPDFAEEIIRRTSWAKDLAKKCVPLMRERVSVWNDIATLKDEFGFLTTAPSLDAAAIPGKGNDTRVAIEHLTHAMSVFSVLPPEDFKDAERVKAALWDYATEKGRGAVLWPLRYALSGRDKSPDPFMIATIIGKEEVRKRISAALDILKK